MGVYSHYANSIASATVAADESYQGAAGAYQMIEDGEINSYTIFESVIGRDFAEAGNMHGFVNESDISAINEASASGIWEAVVNFVQKIWAKIKGILESIKTKIVGTFTKDGKALIKKYEKTINTKLNSGKLSDFKFKWKSVKNNDIGEVTFGSTVKTMLTDSSPLSNYINANLKAAKALRDTDSKVKRGEDSAKTTEVSYKDDKGTDRVVKTGSSHDDISKVNDTEDYGSDATKSNVGLRPYTSDECTDMLEEALGDICKTVGGSEGSISAKEFAKEFHDAVFDDEEEKDKFSDVVDNIKETLTTSKKILNGITKAENESDRFFREKKKQAADISKAMNKLNEKKETQSTVAAAANRLAGRTTTCLNIMNKVSGMTFAAATSVVKEHIKQCRATWIKAAAYNQKKQPYEEATMLEAMGDVSDYEVEEMFSLV